jgi:hypothetical protein
MLVVVEFEPLELEVETMGVDGDELAPVEEEVLEPEELLELLPELVVDVGTITIPPPVPDVEVVVLLDPNRLLDEVETLEVEADVLFTPLVVEKELLPDEVEVFDEVVVLDADFELVVGIGRMTPPVPVPNPIPVPAAGPVVLVELTARH